MGDFAATRPSHAERGARSEFHNEQGSKTIPASRAFQIGLTEPDLVLISPPSGSVSVKVPVLNNGTDTVVQSSEKLEGIVATVDAGFR